MAIANGSSIALNLINHTNSMPITKQQKTEMLERAYEATEEGESIGFCLDCGEGAESCEPDIENGFCESCGSQQVAGVEQFLIRFET